MGHWQRWTDEEDEHLLDRIGYVKVTTIAKELGRSQESITRRARKLGVGKLEGFDGRLTARDMSRALNVHMRKLLDWIEHDGFPARKKVMVRRQTYWLTFPEDFWRWAEKNKQLIDFSRVDKFALLPEPEWVAAERKKDNLLPKNRFSDWTHEDRERLISMNKGGYTNNEVAEQLGRTEGSVRGEVSRLIKSGRLKSRHIQIPWTLPEVEFLVESKENGKSYDFIAWELGRERESVRKKYERLKGRRSA